jgi:hypothetical protein
MLALLLALTVGCTPTVKDVCGSLDDSCNTFTYGACVENGEAIEESAQRLGCSSVFEDYLGCVSAYCSHWDELCAPQRKTLEACVGEFP